MKYKISLESIDGGSLGYESTVYELMAKDMDNQEEDKSLNISVIVFKESTLLQHFQTLHHMLDALHESLKKHTGD